MPNPTLDQLMPKLEALAPAEVSAPDLPMAVALQEGHDLATLVARADVRRRLLAVGLPAETLDELPLAVDATRAAQSDWVVARDRSKPEAQAAREQQVYALRGELLAACRWSLREDRVGLATVAAIAEGEGIADAIQDLRDLAQLITSRQARFAADTTFEAASAVDRAVALAADAEQGVSLTRLADEQARCKDLRDRAYTVLSDHVSTVREAGRYAYRDDLSLRSQFASAYQRRKRRRRAAVVSGATPETPIPPATPATN